MNKAIRYLGRSAALAATTAALSLASPDQARADTTFPLISAGGYHVCTVKNDGELWCWGWNAAGQLGDGTNTDKYFPWQITSVGKNAVEIAAGYDHTCARMKDGSLWCWGLNNDGQLGDGTNTSRNAPVQVTALGNTVAGVSAGDQHTCARKTDGTLWCWGYNNFGQLGDGTNTSRNFPVQVATSGSFIEVSAGGEHTCGRKSDSTLWCWGDNVVGMLGDGTTTNRNTPVPVVGLGTPAAEVSAGEDHTCARLTDETLWCWGSNNNAQIGDGSHTDSSLPVWVDRLGTMVTQVSAGTWSTCAREVDNSLWCWGRGGDGQLGKGTNLEKSIPTKVSVLGPVNQVSAGQYFACAYDANSLPWCWGSALTGQLGRGNLTSSNVPVQPLNFTNPAVPASNPAKELALACALLLCGVALIDRRRLRSMRDR